MAADCTQRNNLYLPALLVIMDGLALDEPSEANAVSLAHTPYLDQLFERCSWTTLMTCGEHVGLPDGQMGNSEVGHMNIGAGRIVYQELSRINRAIDDGSFDQNPVLVNAIQDAVARNATVHVIGLASQGGVHSQLSHGMRIVSLAASLNARVAVHAFTDGRDVDPHSGLDFINTLDEHCKKLAKDSSKFVGIATIAGRYYAMDRDERWDRVKRAWDVMVHPQEPCGLLPAEAMQASYDAGVTDEFVEPVCIEPVGISSDDVVIFFNFRADRARQMTRALTESDFPGFERDILIDPARFVTLTEYHEDFVCPIAFPKVFPENTLADAIADAGLKQYHTAETEKYAHVTFFLNGAKETPKLNEVRKLIASPQVATYDLQPEMSAHEVTAELLAAIESNTADVYIVNYANCDMVGHTGDVKAAVRAVETVDEALSQIVPAILKRGGFALITADHGNADCMFTVDEKGNRRPHTAHTLAPVPFILAEAEALMPPASTVRHDTTLLSRQNTGALCDIAPTLFALIGLETPSEWTGRSLLC